MWNDLYSHMKWFYISKILKFTHQKLLELINEFIKVLGFKVNKQKIVVLYINYTSIQINFKKQLYCHTLVMNNPKMELRKQFHLQENQKNKMGNTCKSM